MEFNIKVTIEKREPSKKEIIIAFFELIVIIAGIYYKFH
ncbi:hypothetical protein ACUXCJ_001734 [Staphylococcus haemolyticus]|nr:hypothetical protein BDW31_1061 [Staphylococcus sp. AtHG25]